MNKSPTAGSVAPSATEAAPEQPPPSPERLHTVHPEHLATIGRTELEAAVQRRAQAIYLGDDVVLTRVLTRYKMLLHARDRGFACHVMLDGFWEFWLTQFFARTIRPGMRVVDVGANYGYYTLLFADIVTRSGHVLAVEPNPAATALLRQSLLLNGFGDTVDVVETALGADPEGEVMLVIPENEPKNAHVSTIATGPSRMVPATSLDSLAAQFGPFDLVKIDAEGSEAAIIEGMQQLLRTSPPAIVLEFNTSRCTDPAALLDKLTAVYGNPGAIDFDANVQLVARDTLLNCRPGEDWLLYFPALPAAAA